MKEAVMNFIGDPSVLAAFIGLVSGFLVKNGVTKVIKKTASWLSPRMKEAGEALLAGGEFCNVINKNIAEDGSYAENSISEIKAAGKTFVKEVKDNFGNTVIVTVEPK